VEEGFLEDLENSGTGGQGVVTTEDNVTFVNIIFSLRSDLKCNKDLSPYIPRPISYSIQDSERVRPYPWERCQFAMLKRYIMGIFKLKLTKNCHKKCHVVAYMH
jgi:hypothetical protein